MTRLRLLMLLPLALMACSTLDQQGTIAQLRNVQVEVREEQIEGGLEKAMEGYQRFLEEMPDSRLAPEAIRRLADLKVEQEYGLVSDSAAPAVGLSVPDAGPQPRPLPEVATAAPTRKQEESERDFESRATARTQSASETDPAGQPGEDLEKAGPLEAIALYQKLLKEYPLYEHNDQVLYQMSRAYEELGRIEAAMEVMDRLVREFPHSRYLDEVQFRRAEYFFVHRKFLAAEEAYASIVAIGVGSSYYQLALYKLGWTFYKQELYEEALHRFIALLDYQVSVGYDFAQTTDETERKRMQDTFRVISLSFSYLGGAQTVVDYFSRGGPRSFEHRIYSNLGEYYFDKRRYSDAVATYSAFLERNPFHRMAPNFQMRIIEVNLAGGFPSLVLEAKKAFATDYGLTAAYWQHFAVSDRPEVLGFLKTNLTDLANHYHAQYRDPQHKEAKAANFTEALRWYREFLNSFPADADAPTLNYQLADLLLENGAFAASAQEYEKTAYAYPAQENASKAGYAAVYAYRKHLDNAPDAAQPAARREVVRASLKFAAVFPAHEKAAIVLGAAADDLFVIPDFAQALTVGQQLIATYPDTDPEVLRGAWLVVAHASYELDHFSAAEAAYGEVLARLPTGDKTRSKLVDNLAAAIYKQGEAARALEDYRAAAEHFLRVGRKAPESTLRPSAEYDAAAALIQLKDWSSAISVLSGFRNAFPGHALQPEVTKKMAFVYREAGDFAQAATEFEQIEKESGDEEVRREALQVAAQMHEQAGNPARQLEVLRRFVSYFPQPLEPNLENRNTIAAILKQQGNPESYLDELRQIVALDATASEQRTERTSYLAAKAALVLAELQFDRFQAVRLVKPFAGNLKQKKALMKTATQAFTRLTDYEVGDVTAAATYYLAAIYADFSQALLDSERPAGLSPLELEQYELAIEEQAYPFEEKSIAIHESNLELIPRGVYNPWIEKSLAILARVVPARYAKPEEPSEFLSSMDRFVYIIEQPAAPAPVSAAAASIEPSGQSEVRIPDTNAAQPEAPVTTTESVQTEAAAPVAEPAEPGDTAVDAAGAAAVPEAGAE
jgi:outer membrane protein assembly factor BamD (BamD/ComL family)